MLVLLQERGREKGEGRREKGEGGREKGEGRREKGEGRREKGKDMSNQFHDLEALTCSAFSMLWRSRVELIAYLSLHCLGGQLHITTSDLSALGFLSHCSRVRRNVSCHCYR